MRFDLQINPGTSIWPIARDAAIAAESAGFKALWTVDHLAGDVMQAPDMPECFTLLGALAGVTKQIELGPLVVNVGNRHPGLLANSVATAQQISGGRFVLGLGAGASPNSPFAAERHAIGLSPPAKLADRHAVLTNALDVMQEMGARSPSRTCGVSVAKSNSANHCWRKQCHSGKNRWSSHERHQYSRQPRTSGRNLGGCPRCAQRVWS